MLFNLTLSNWGPFTSSVEFWMIPFPKLTQHKNHPIAIKKYRTKVLPLATLFGANASGKSAFIASLAFFQTLVLDPSTHPSRLASRARSLALDADHPTTWEWTFFAGQSLYVYAVALNDKGIIEEKLNQILTQREHVLFERHGQTFTGKIFSEASARHLAYSTATHQLLLSHLFEEGYTPLLPLKTWFESLRFFSDSTAWQPLLPMPDAPLITALSQLGIPITDTSMVPAYLDALDHTLRDTLLATLYANPGVSYDQSLPNGTLLRAHVDATTHQLHVMERRFSFIYQGKALTLGGSELSVGTRQLLRLLPVFYRLSHTIKPQIVFIDDFDAHLHPLVQKKILSDYLQTLSGQSTSQLILTLKGADILDQTLLRRDEIWFTEYSDLGSSLRTLTSFVDHEGRYVRFDKVIRKDYFKGVFGGIPHLSDSPLFESH